MRLRTGLLGLILLVPSVAFGFFGYGAVFTHNLSYGQSGTEVASLQQFLIDEGDFSASPNGYFGLATYAGVKAFQTQEGITPANGNFGPTTRAHANAILAEHPEWVTTLSNTRTYTNVSGSTVHSPSYSTNGVPAGASAQCRDGTYSLSMHHSGTCSHHGGVASWL